MTEPARYSYCRPAARAARETLHLIPVAEQRLLDTTVAAAKAAAARHELFAGAAQLHACLKRAQRLSNTGVPWGGPLVRQYGHAFAEYLAQHRLHTFAACRVGAHHSPDIRPNGRAEAGEPARELVTVLFGPEVRVEYGNRDEPLIRHANEGAGFTLNSAIEYGWACVLDDVPAGVEE